MASLREIERRAEAEVESVGLPIPKLKKNVTPWAQVDVLGVVQDDTLRQAEVRVIVYDTPGGDVNDWAQKVWAQLRSSGSDFYGTNLMLSIPDQNARDTDADRRWETAEISAVSLLLVG